MTDSDLSASPRPQLAPVALAIAMALVTQGRLRLTHESDSRLGPLAGDYPLGAGMWTGPRSAFVGFFSPSQFEPLVDIERRVTAAAQWGTVRLSMQPAERCDILLIALTPVGGQLAPPEVGDERVHISVVSIDSDHGDAAQLLDGAKNLPGARQLRAYAKSVRNGATAPTLAAVDLAERQTVQTGYVQPARSALSSTPYITYSLIASWVLIWLFQQAVAHEQNYGNGYVSFAVDPASFGWFFAAPGEPHEWWRFIASGFLHDFFSPLHVILNSVAMLWIGRFIEQIYGRLVLLGTFLVGTAGGCLLVLVLNSIGLYDAPGGVVGSSSGICGFIGLILVLGRVQGNGLPAGMAAAIRKNALYNTVFILAYSFLIPGIAWPGHLGGFLVGALVGLLLPPLRRVGGRDLSVYEKTALVGVIAVGAVALGFAALNVISATGPPLA